MKFFYRNLGNLRGGEVVEFTLKGSAANVQLIDSPNFAAYKARRRYQSVGGHATRSPVRLKVPHAGHWYAVLDFGGYSGRTRWNVELLPGPLPTIRETPLSAVPSLVRPRSALAVAGAAGPYDVFISHASEDKESVARPLAHALRSAGLTVWYDEFTLRIGMSLRRTIDQGVATSRFGVVVLSQAFFGKGWTNYELDGLVTKAVTGEQVILPIWHNVSKQEVQQYSPSLADTVARSTANFTLSEIASEITDVIRAATSDPR